MKLIRLTDDRYVLDMGMDATPGEMEVFRRSWENWWAQNPGGVPMAFYFGGMKIPLEYEDRRDSDIEQRIQNLERAVFGE